MFGTLQKRLPQELRIHGITDMEEANRFLRERFLPEHNARFARKAEQPGNAFTPLMGFALDDVLCIQEERVVAKDNTLRYKGEVLQILEDASRCSYAKCKVRVHEYLDGSLAVLHGPRRIQSAVLASKQEENKEVDYSDAFIAFDPDSVLASKEGANTPSSPDTGYPYGALVARQQCPILRMAENISAQAP
jgi:hypothetical protein